MGAGRGAAAAATWIFREGRGRSERGGARIIPRGADAARGPAVPLVELVARACGGSVTAPRRPRDPSRGVWRRGVAVGPGSRRRRPGPRPRRSRPSRRPIRRARPRHGFSVEAGWQAHARVQDFLSRERREPFRDRSSLARAGALGRGAATTARRHRESIARRGACASRCRDSEALQALQFASATPNKEDASRRHTDETGMVMTSE